MGLSELQVHSEVLQKTSFSSAKINALDGQMDMSQELKSIFKNVAAWHTASKPQTSVELNYIEQGERSVL